MLSLGGVGCDEEFAAFLVANPTYTQLFNLDVLDFTPYKRPYLCADQGIRFYEVPEPTCYEAFLTLLSLNPTWRGLTPEGMTALGAGDSQQGGWQGITLYNPNTGFYPYQCTDDYYSVFYVFYITTQIANDYTVALAANPSWTIVL
jgi:hypothetical protein